MDEPKNYHTKWSKSDRGRQISYEVTNMWTLIKNDTKVLRKQTKILKPNLWLPKGKCEGRDK